MLDTVGAHAAATQPSRLIARAGAVEPIVTTATDSPLTIFEGSG